ncbi:MAG TPA: tRNA (guanosine(37)-N1)-methyltransferase TrmD [Polyangiaceae bacterium]|jgi:tRNA (guanine37-N1)-methyltransferase|nr:tRNA (guanosine(37)-N1)-methyltransferase TrmD [Polyangiaceae bacterium]
MQIDIVSLFPECIEPLLTTSIVGRAVESGLVRVRIRSPRQFGIGRHLKVDDTPYGGGSGMVMRVDCIVACMESLDGDREGGAAAHRVLLTPQGERLAQRHLHDLAAKPAFLLVCGRYEGFDERVRSFVDQEISLGDFVVAGGEVAAMAIVEGVARLLPGVLGNEASATEESHSLSSGGILEYPQYTRPAEFRGNGVPEVLVGGNHGEIARYRGEQALQRTRERRPDLLDADKTLPQPPRSPRQ